MIITRHPSDSSAWVQWRNPHRIVTAWHTEEVNPALRAVEAAVAEGRHALGFMAYEAGPACDPHIRVRPPDRRIPLLWFGLFDAFEPFTPPAGRAVALPWKPLLDRRSYRKAVDRIRRHIASGDTYQVNYTFPLIAEGAGSVRDMFFHLVHGQPTPYAMLIETSDFAVASASPELFFSLEGASIRVEPMKGTSPRGFLPVLDRQAGEQLRDSGKNRAENIMIVDMMRNDLGRIAVPGSVRVDSLFDVKPWPTLWQMTSSISARTTATVPEILGALFPCASITGAPKIKTTEIIADLETAPRGVYTGAIGTWFPGRRATFAVAIRTAVVDMRDNRSVYGIGSGIVWDSDPDDEYRECLLKARIVARPEASFQLLETIRWDASTGYVLLEKHLDRMQDSAAYFGRTFNRNQAADRLDRLSRRFSDASQRVRLLVRKNGTVTVQHRSIDEPGWFGDPRHAPEMTAGVDSRRTDQNNPFLYHKTTRRTIYHQARKRCPLAAETLLVNRRGELMEFTTGNLVLVIDGAYVTPDLPAGLLPGVFRGKLLADGVIQARTLTLADLDRAGEAFFINSVRGWRRIRFAPS